MKIYDADNPLVTTYAIREIHVPSRFFLAPINTGFFENGAPTEGMRRFHRERSGKMIGLSYVGNVAVDGEYTNSPTTAFLSAEAAWKDIASEITSNGSLPAIQLACKTLGEPAPIRWVSKDVQGFVQRMREHLISLSTDKLDNVCDQFVSSAQIASNHGFRVIQVHAAHGYFFSLLLSKQINKRQDRYGDGIETIRGLLATIRAAAGECLIDLRLSVSSGISNREAEVEEFESQIAQLTDSELDIISLSDGFYDVNKFQIYPRVDDGLGCYVSIANRLASRYPSLLWNVAGNVWDIRSLVGTMMPNLTLSIGRALIADPAFVEKQVAGDGKDVRHCTRSGHCHYYSRGQPHISCKVNPSVGGDT